MRILFIPIFIASLFIFSGCTTEEDEFPFEFQQDNDSYTSSADKDSDGGNDIESYPRDEEQSVDTELPPDEETVDEESEVDSENDGETSAVCGNGTVEEGEICDSGTKNCTEIDSSLYESGVATCKADCSGWDTSNCKEKPQPVCGNNIVEGTEVCDGNTKECTEIDSSYIDGTASCKNDCSGWDTTNCKTQTCGNGTLDTGEVCEQGDTKQCSDFHDKGYVNAETIPCNQSCSDWDYSNCKCEEGYEKDPSDEYKCKDIDECSNGTAQCEQVCVNEEGTYHCECNDYYELNTDGKSCDFCNTDQKCGKDCTPCSDPTPKCKDNGDGTSECVECLTNDDCTDGKQCIQNQCKAQLPPLKVEIYQGAWSDDMRTVWYSPSGASCSETGSSSKTCDWQSEGTATISGDKDGYRNPNWMELTNVTPVSTAHYYVKIYSPWNHEGDEGYPCEIKEARVYVNSQLVRTVDYSLNKNCNDGNDWLYDDGPKYLCMPISNGNWDTSNFRFTESESDCK